MRRIAGLILCLSATVPLAWAANGEMTPAEVFSADSPSVVVVESFDKDGNAIAQGSGVVIAKGVVVSNCHVFEEDGSESAKVFYRAKSYPAELKYGDPEHDLCSFTVAGLTAPVVSMGTASSLKIGDPAYAIGAPEGLDLTLSNGLISGLRQIPGGVMIQTTAPISPGSSGGGLFDSHARLIGITSYYMDEGQQLNFAVPVEWIKELPQRGKLTKATASQSHKRAEEVGRPGSVNPSWQNAVLAAYGKGDYAAVLKIVEPLAEHGNASAQVWMGFLSAEGQGVAKDYSKEAYWNRKAAEQGNAEAQGRLGYEYESGEGVAQNYSKALYWLTKSAVQGDMIAQNNLGAMYGKSEGVTQDYAKARYWYEKAALEGLATAQVNLGALYENGHGVPQDYVTARYWFRKAADQGWAGGENALGILYEQGQGVSQDYAEAMYWFSSAAEQGDAEAQYGLGCMYLYGEGVPQDYTKALHWFRQAANQAYALAEVGLGFLYKDGDAVPQDYAQAVHWYTKAANQGDASGQLNLAAMYANGLGVSEDDSKASYWYRRAAEQGETVAQAALGARYLLGRGVPQDYVQAAKWLILAKAGGDKNAPNLLASFESKMSPTQIAEAQRLASQWWATHGQP